MEIKTEYVWAEFNERVFSFILKRLKNRDVSNDILQDVFTKIHLKLPTLKETDKLTAWVYQITRNSIVDHFRKQKKDAFSDKVVEVIDEGDDENMIEFNGCIDPFVNRLPEKYRDALLQTELGSLSQKEYAEKIGISYSGAKSRVQRAKIELKKLFTDCCSFNTDKYGNIIEYNRGEDCPC